MNTFVIQIAKFCIDDSKLIGMKWQSFFVIILFKICRMTFVNQSLIFLGKPRELCFDTISSRSSNDIRNKTWMMVRHSFLLKSVMTKSSFISIDFHKCRLSIEYKMIIHDAKNDNVICLNCWIMNFTFYFHKIIK